VPDIVICAAGGATPGLFVETSTDVLRKNLSIVYDTALYFSHAAVKAMIKGDTSTERHLVYCSSVLALFPFIGYSSYGPAKAAIRALADIVRQECIPYNIAVSNILPGNMATEGYEEEMKTKPEITIKIEGPSTPRDPDVVAKEVIRDLKRGREMIYTDFIGWFLSGLMLGASPRTLGFFQALFAIILAIFAPVWSWIMRRDIRNYFKANASRDRQPLESPKTK
jgi:3-dehydrosphinganine reductase